MQIYHLINGLFRYFNSKASVLILTPYARNMGNCAEEIYYGLLKARRDGKRALFLFPRQLGWKFRCKVANQEMFQIESDHSLPNNNLGCKLAGYLITVVFIFLRYSYFMSRMLLQKFQRIWPKISIPRRHNIWYVVASIGRSTLWQPEGVGEFSWDVVRSCRWGEQYKQHLPVRLPREKHQKAESLRVAMGIPLDGWFVCLHVREGGFQGDWELGANRNCSILNYVEGIKAITDAGGFVVRLGDSTMTRLPSMKRVIDYPFTPFKSELMDLYLISQCRFYVGVNSGPLDVAWLFQKHVVLTNLTDWTMSFPKYRGDLAILRHVFSKSRNRFLSLKEILKEPFECQSIREAGADYFLMENTPQEIRDVILEHLDAPRDYQYSELQEIFNEGRRAMILQWLEQPLDFFSLNRFDDVVERYRFASRLDTNGALGRKHLEDNWLQSSKNEASKLV